MPTLISPAIKHITASDVELERILQDACIPALMMSLVHLSGDPNVMRGDIRPAKMMINEYHGGLTEAQNATVRGLALTALKEYRDGGCTLPSAPTADTVLEMLNFVAGERVADEYVPMMLEELSLDGRDLRAAPWTKKITEQEKQKHKVLIVGAGMSGLLQAMRLKEAGIPFVVVEKNAAVGGTWLENRYPGCRVDIANHFYSYSFEQNQRWNEYFAQRDELLAYFEAFAERHALGPHIRFDTEFTAASYDDASEDWCVTLRHVDKRTVTERYTVLISAVGQLNKPLIPQVDGRESFQGIQMHSAQWDPNVSLQGKRVAVIGAGASAFQLVPSIAASVQQMHVFQRSAPWMMPNPIYHTKVTDSFNWLVEHVPFYGRWFRFLIFWPGSDGILPSLKIDPTWEHPDRAVNAYNDQMREYLTGYLQSQVGDDPALFAKVLPDYPVMGKRMLQDNGSWLKALRQPNVQLVTEAVTTIDATGIVTRDGHVPLDVIVWATGFHATEFLSGLQITGRGGLELRSFWGTQARAYLGITIPKFPNLFCLYGPATNLAHAGSIIFHSECQVRYVMSCLKTLVEKDAKSMECQQSVYDGYVQRLVDELAGLVWSHPKAGSWYRNSEGRVITTSPWRLADYWRWTQSVNLADYHWTC
jgi:4-hydroxyacetophenone monooxygenase